MTFLLTLLVSPLSKAGDGNTPSQIITVDTGKPHGLFKDTPVLIAGITTSINSYNGSFLVDEVVTDTRFKYNTPSIPSNATYKHRRFKTPLLSLNQTL